MDIELEAPLKDSSKPKKRLLLIPASVRKKNL